MNKKNIFIIGFLAIIVIMIVFGRIWSENNSLSFNAAIPGQAAVEQSVGRDRKAPDFSLTSLSGDTITLSQYRGEKPVVLDFFTTWCPNCRRDMPRLSKMYQEYKDQVEVIGINLQENQNKVSKYISSTNIVFPIVLDPFGQTARNYGVRYTNTHVLIGKDGNIVRVISGDIKKSDIEALIQQAET